MGRERHILLILLSLSHHPTLFLIGKKIDYFSPVKSVSVMKVIGEQSHCPYFDLSFFIQFFPCPGEEK